MSTRDTDGALVLQVPATLPSDYVVSRWFAEPIRMMLLSSQAFCTNNKGFPVLTKPQQSLIFRYMKLRSTPYIILSDTDKVPPARGNKDVSRREKHEPHGYLLYIRYLQRNPVPMSIAEQFATGYQDYLQTPLQPLAHNLESITYEVFEKDPVKYNQYEAAIKLALEDRAPDSVTLVP